nr:zinc finger, CCHC-type [Tanacetum cinerariifolium]
MLMCDIPFSHIHEDQTQAASTLRFYKKISMTGCVLFLKVRDAPTVVDQYVTKLIKIKVKLTNCILALRAINVVDLDVGSSKTWKKLRRHILLGLPVNDFKKILVGRFLIDKVACRMTGAKFDIEKFDGTGDFGLWRIKMRDLLIQHECEAALEILPADMKVQTKAELNKKAHSAVILCLGNKVLREVTEETTVAGIWSKLETLYMTKLLANKLYLKKKLYTFYMPAGRKIFEHIDEFNKIVLDLANIEVKFEDEDLALLLLTSLPASYEHFVNTLLYGRKALTLKDVMATLNSKEIKERLKAKGDDGEGLYVRRRTDRNDSRQTRRKSRSKSRGYVKKDKQPSSSGLTDDDSEVMMVISAQAQALLDWIMDSGCSYHMTHRLDILFDFLECDRGSVQLGDRRECKIRVELNASVEEKDSLAHVWHKRLGHISEARLKVLEKQRLFGKKSLENQTKRTVKKLRMDNGLKFYNWEFEQLCIKSGIARHLTVAGTPQQNGVAERMNRTLMNKRLNNHALEEDQTDQEDSDDEDAGDQATDQPPDLTDYQLVRDREPRTRTKPLRFQDESNMAAYAIVTTEKEDTHEPLTYQEAVACEDSSKWKAAMKKEMDSPRKNKTWELVDHPAGKKLMSCKWLFKIKEWIEGVQNPRYKARLVARGFTQRVAIDYNKVFSLTAFLHENLEEMIYMKQPPGYEQDDMLIACKSKAEIESTKSLLKKEFDMKELGEAKKILGMEIVRDRIRKILMVSQFGYVSKILNNFRINNGKSVKMPLGGHFKLSLKDCPVKDCDVEKMSKVPYANAVGSLMYLMVCTRPDIAYATTLRDPDKGRSITGYAFLVHGCVVSWKATLQHVVALSTTDVEYMALTEAVKEAIWLRVLLEELGVELNTVAVNCDNQGAFTYREIMFFMKRLSTSMCIITFSERSWKQRRLKF